MHNSKQRDNCKYTPVRILFFLQINILIFRVFGQSTNFVRQLLTVVSRELLLYLRIYFIRWLRWFSLVADLVGCDCHMTYLCLQAERLI